MDIYRIILLTALFIIWLSAYILLRKKQMTAFSFIEGAGGSFCFLFLILKNSLSFVLTKALIGVLSFLKPLMNFYDTSIKYSTLFIERYDASISLVVDYECCGVIEILIILCIIWFYPIFSARKKIYFSLIGIFYTFIANLIRLFCVMLIIYKFGSSSYYIAHSLIGRVVFYVLTIFMYFYLLTYPQIKNQKTGEFTYTKD